MAFIKGQSGNPQGRPQGTSNKISKILKEQIEQFLIGKFESVNEVWDDLEPNQKVNALIKLVDFVLPRMKTIESDLTFHNQDQLKKDVSALFPTAEELDSDQGTKESNQEEHE